MSDAFTGFDSTLTITVGEESVDVTAKEIQPPASTRNSQTGMNIGDAAEFKIKTHKSHDDGSYEVYVLNADFATVNGWYHSGADCSFQLDTPYLDVSVISSHTRAWDGFISKLEPGKLSNSDLITCKVSLAVDGDITETFGD